MIENTTLCYPEHNGRLLLLHRTKKERDINRDKWIGVGGHMEAGESPEDCIRREMREETGLTADELAFRGIVTFVYRETTEYMFLFTARKMRGASGMPVSDDTDLPECREGELAWVSWEEIYALPIWEGDRIFLKLLQQNAPFFSLKLVYDDRGNLTEAVRDGHSVHLT
ncbi:MAG: 8-oxo-dGTP diphosphatase [Lachnospiraceae bacterium]|nr:8-oxo-dGTP diphosphatase [Lachnospiraceae bacterium]